jgi:hypothetical protein
MHGVIVDGRQPLARLFSRTASGRRGRLFTPAKGRAAKRKLPLEMSARPVIAARPLAMAAKDMRPQEKNAATALDNLDDSGYKPAHLRLNSFFAEFRCVLDACGKKPALPPPWGRSNAPLDHSGSWVGHSSGASQRELI